MSKSIADLRTSPSTGLPRRSYPLCLANSLLAEMQSLTNELGDLEIPRDDGDTPKSNRRVNAKVNPRVAEINARIAVLDAEIVEHTGELVLQGTDVGVWTRWTDAHPAREEGAPGYQRDLRVSGGYCNGDALVDALGTYAESWNGEPVTDADWEFIKSKAAPGDLTELARLVVVMHETAVDLPKLRSAWRDVLRSEQD